MATALIGGAFLSASLQVLFDRMASPEFINFFRSEKQQRTRLLPRLRSTLVSILAVLDDADNKQFTSTSIKDWLDELQDAVYYADDLIDEITSNEICTDSEIECVIERLDYFVKYKDVLGLREIGGGSRFMSNRLATSSLVDEIGVYGLNDDKEKIVKLLLDDGEDSVMNRVLVVPIVGMGGIGKTTLAQLVYNDSRVDKHFDRLVWVCVSEQFDVLRITKTILEAVTLQRYDINDDLNQLQVELIQSLKQQKFLLVLDDVWNESYNVWDVLRMPFRAGACGSKVIVTTRNAGVASMMQTVHFHRVRELSDDDCWSLFSKHAFENGYIDGMHPDLEVVGKEILKKCGGLPLAAKTLGGLLRGKLDIEEWEYISKSEIWDLPNDKSDILPALRLSYHYLPSRVKRCFAHCSVFSKDYEFQKEELVLIWMAENLLLPQPKSNLTMEEIGEQCFREMVSRSFLQQAYNNKPQYFVMHDLIHDLAQFISGGSCLSLENDKQPLVHCEKVRHFSYVRGEFDALNKFQEIANVKILRTFLPLELPLYYAPNYMNRSLYLNTKVIYGMLPTLRCLRVLSLSHYNIVELPHSIVCLRHLRYFDVSYTKIKSLPDSITTLCNLQTLLLSHCRLLTQLPQDMKKLIFLRHLDLSGTNLNEMPTGMERLKNLGFMSTFVVGKDSGSRISILSELRHLRRALSIVRLENVMNTRDASDANLKAKNKLEKLVLEWSVTTENLQDEFDVLSKLQPHKNLKQLTIKNYVGEIFPSWLGDHVFANMVSLRLESCSGCLLLPRLGQLSSLKFLMIGGMKEIKVVGAEFYGDHLSVKPFSSLEILRFEDMAEWEEWQMLGVGEFSGLQELHMVNCPKLTGNLPEKVLSIRRLEIFGCHQLLGSHPTNQLAIFFDQVRLLKPCLSSLQKLVISDIINLTTFPPALSSLVNLEVLTIDECHSLEHLENTNLPSAVKILIIQCCSSLRSLPKEMAQTNNRLKDLVVFKCPSLVSFPSSGLPHGLTTLDISFCGKFELYGEMDNCYASIEHLRLRLCCSLLKSFSLGLCKKIVFLRILGCFSFERFLIPDRLQNLIQLRFIEIKYCSNVISFLDGILPALNLSLVRVSTCKNLRTLPSFSSLRSLYLVECPKLECLSEGYLPSNLRVLSISNCLKLVARRKHWGLQRLSTLREFTIDGEYDEETLKNFPEEWLLPSSLSELVISSSLNLKMLNHRGFRDLSSLKSLRIYNCPRLESLPEEPLPGSLSALCVNNCPLLIRRCQKDKGADWLKIAHIPFIEVDDVIL